MVLFSVVYSYADVKFLILIISLTLLDSDEGLAKTSVLRINSLV